MKKLLPLFLAVFLIVVLAAPVYAASASQPVIDGVILPDLPSSGSYAVIYVYDGSYIVGFSPVPWKHSSSTGELYSDSNCSFYQLKDNSWEYWYSNSANRNTVSSPIWTNTDIYTSSGELFLAAPVPPSVTLSLDTVSIIYPGMNCQLSAVVSGDGISDPTLTWTVTGADSSLTSISSSGFLNIGKDETASVLIVTAVLAEDTSVFDSLEIILTPRPNPVKAFLTSVGQIFASAVSWVGDVGSTILQQPLLLAFTALPLCGLGIAVFRRLKETV